jgi:ABC-type phosphate/phosphonate transport system substrate-binding protein
MLISSKRLLRAAAILTGLSLASAAQAADLRVVLRQSQEGEIGKYKALGGYLAKRGIQLKFVMVPGYREAAAKFGDGSVDAMFGGSGISCAMMVTGVAEPLARLAFTSAPQTYSAVVVAKRGSPAFDGTPGWFAGKRVAFQGLASGGEFFFRSLGPSAASGIVLAASHRAALDAVANGSAEVAVVKNHTWTKDKGAFPGLEQVGQDDGLNPDGPVIVSTRIAPELRKSLFDAMMALAEDASPEAAAAKGALQISGFLRATPKDFKHTMDLVERSGVTKDFAFRF